MRIAVATKLAAVVILPLLLAACFFVPGKFVSTMGIEKNGRFSFAYKGEIVAFTGKRMMDELGKRDTTEEKFSPYCVDEESDESRDCTAAEMDEQKKQWEAGKADRAKTRADKDREDGEMASAMMGFNPRDPKTIDAFIAKLMKQKGWNSVVHKGDGVFEVDYAITGTLDRDFIFPSIPDVSMPQPMVIARVRKDNSVMIEAPGFGSADKQARSQNVFAALAKEGGPGSDQNPLVAAMDGIFTVTTDGEILTNNTDDGPTTTAGRKTLNWRANAQSTKVPETLIQLGR